MPQARLFRGRFVFPALLTLTITLSAQQPTFKLVHTHTFRTSDTYITWETNGLAHEVTDNGVLDNETGSIIAALTITSGYPPSGVVGRLYDFRCTQIPLCNVFRAGFSVTAAGGVQPYKWTWAAQPGSTLPPGLTFPSFSSSQCLNVSRPAICGKPTKAGSFNVTITVTDSESPAHHAIANYTIRISQ
jgi:hypothetical protein